jgi:hypothetical protein
MTVISSQRPIASVNGFIFDKNHITLGGWALDIASNSHDLVVELTRYGLKAIYAGEATCGSRAAQSESLIIEAAKIVTETSQRVSGSLSVDALMDKYSIDFFDIVFIRPGRVLDSWKGIWARQLCIFHNSGHFINKADLSADLNRDYPAAATDGRCLLMLSQAALRSRK